VALKLFYAETESMKRRGLTDACPVKRSKRNRKEQFLDQMNVIISLATAAGGDRAALSGSGARTTQGASREIVSNSPAAGSDC
jgi:hypothetical protein